MMNIVYLITIRGAAARSREMASVQRFLTLYTKIESRKTRMEKAHRNRKEPAPPQIRKRLFAARRRNILIAFSLHPISI
jgi:hypothetical protein